LPVTHEYIYEVEVGREWQDMIKFKRQKVRVKVGRSRGDVVSNRTHHKGRRRLELGEENGQYAVG
jgi:hypothetical protein